MAEAKKKAEKKEAGLEFEKRFQDFGEEMEALGKRIGKSFEDQDRETEESRKSKESPKTKKLYRSGKERILGGVCGGLAEYLNFDPMIVRLFWVLLAFLGGIGIVLYIIAWIFIPRNPQHKWDEKIG